jgi:hypothetical protein
VDFAALQGLLKGPYHANTQDFDHFDTIDLPRRGFLTATALGMATDDVNLAALPRIRQKLVARPPYCPSTAKWQPWVRAS